MAIEMFHSKGFGRCLASVAILVAAFLVARWSVAFYQAPDANLKYVYPAQVIRGGGEWDDSFFVLVARFDKVVNGNCVLTPVATLRGKFDPTDPANRRKAILVGPTESERRDGCEFAIVCARDGGNRLYVPAEVYKSVPSRKVVDFFSGVKGYPGHGLVAWIRTLDADAIDRVSQTVAAQRAEGIQQTTPRN